MHLHTTYSATNSTIHSVSLYTPFHLIPFSAQYEFASKLIVVLFYVHILSNHS